MKSVVLASILALGTLAGAQPTATSETAPAESGAATCSGCQQVAIIAKITSNDCVIAQACAKVLGGGGAAANEGAAANGGAVANDGALANDGAMANEGALSNEGHMANEGAVANEGHMANDGAAAPGESAGADHGNTCPNIDLNTILSSLLTSADATQLQNVLGGAGGLASLTNILAGGEPPAGGTGINATAVINILPNDTQMQLCSALYDCGNFDPTGSFGSCPEAATVKPAAASGSAARRSDDTMVLCHDSFIGDGVCDHVCNHAVFDYDGGDCA